MKGVLYDDGEGIGRGEGGRTNLQLGFAGGWGRCEES